MFNRNHEGRGKNGTRRVPATSSAPGVNAAGKNDSRTLSCAVVGCGYWGPNHLRVLSGLRVFGERRVDDARPSAGLPAVSNGRPRGAAPAGEPSLRVELTAVDQDPGRLDWVAANFPRVRRETQLSVVLDDSRIDALVIATPAATHAKIVSAALHAGKHVLCEKPLCTEPHEARELVSLAEHVGRVLMTGHTCLFSPGAQVLKNLIDSAELGELRHLSSIRANLGPVRSDVNVVYDLVSHDVAIFNWLLGGLPESVTAMGCAWVQPGIEDVAYIHLRYPQGRIASVKASWLDPEKVRQITVVGSRRMAVWDDLVPKNPLAIYDRGARATTAGIENGCRIAHCRSRVDQRSNVSPDRFSDGRAIGKVTTWDGDVRLPRVPAVEPLRAQDASFLRAVCTGHVEQSDGRFSADVVAVLSAISQSLNQGGACVRVRSDEEGRSHEDGSSHEDGFVARRMTRRFSRQAKSALSGSTRRAP